MGVTCMTGGMERLDPAFGSNQYTMHVCVHAMLGVMGQMIRVLHGMAIGMQAMHMKRIIHVTSKATTAPLA
jgi:hypothetical protein